MPRRKQRLKVPETRVGAEDLPRMRLLAVLRQGKGDGVAVLLPARHLREKLVARLVLDLQPLLGHERVGGVAPVVRQALGVPGLLAPGAVEERRGLVEIAHAEGGGARGRGWARASRPGRGRTRPGRRAG